MRGVSREGIPHEEKRSENSLWPLLSSLAKTFDLMSPQVADHCARVAYLSLRLGEELSFPPGELQDLCIAGALHDIGAFSLQERLDILAFEESKPTKHALAGYLLLKDVPLFSRPASRVDLLVNYYDRINRFREASQAKAVEEYETFRAALS